MMKKIVCACLLSAAVMLTACESQTGNVSTAEVEETAVSTQTTTEEVDLNGFYSEDVQAFKDAIDTEYGYNLAYKLAYDETLGGECGFRTAGSDYEHLAADYLAEEMKNIGLTDIEMIPVTVDKWQFDYSSLTVEGTDINITPASYAVNGTDEDGITAEIVNVGTGFAEDYEGLDVEGKIVLCAVDQRNVEWIDSYMQEAKLHGAAAIVSYSVGGYAMYSDDDRNIQDVCCDDIIPSVSISRNEASALIEAIEAGNNMCTLVVENTMEVDGGTSYTVVGKIKGSDANAEQIIYSAHYDKYYYGFQDDCCAISLIFTIAKAMVDSGYTPDNDIMIVCHGAEEWGQSNCQFDWTKGAWETINVAHPEWAGKTIGMFNFELPGFLEETQTSTQVMCVPEYYDYVTEFVNEYGSLVDNGTFEEGVLSEAGAVATMEDGISYRFAGVPYFLNGGVDFTDETLFAGQKYHSESDNASTWSEGAFSQNAALYGGLGIVLDSNAAIELNLSNTVDWLVETYDADYATEAGLDASTLTSLAEEVKIITDGYYKQALELNEEIKTAEDGSAIKAEGHELNAKMLATFKTMQDGLIGVESSANVVIRHEGYKNTLDLLKAAIEACDREEAYAEDGESGALDILWAVNTGYAYASYVFSSENMEQTNAMYSTTKEDNLWGTDKVTEFADVDAAIRYLNEEDYASAKEELEAQYAKALEGYKASVEREIDCLSEIMLDK